MTKKTKKKKKDNSRKLGLANAHQQFGTNGISVNLCILL